MNKKTISKIKANWVKILDLLLVSEQCKRVRSSKTDLNFNAYGSMEVWLDV